MKCCLHDIAFPRHARDAGPIPFDFLNPGTWKVDAGGSDTRGHHQLQRRSEASSGSTNLYLKKKLKEDKGIQRQRFYFL